MAYLVFLANIADPEAVGTISQCLEQLVKKQSSGEKCLNSPLVQILCTDSQFKTAEVHDGSWTYPWDLDLEHYKKEETVDEKKETDRCTEESSLSNRLLQVSDSLPYAGVDVHVVLVRPTLQESNAAECYLPLFGALKKLSCWHNAEITVITDGVSQSVQALGDFTGASITSQTSSISWEDDHVWRGKVAVMNKVEGQGHVFPGFQLQCDRDDLEAFLDRLRELTNRHQPEQTGVPVMGRMLEVLDQVDARTLPSFMLTPYTLQLSLWKPHQLSVELVRELQEQEETAVICRLAVYDSASMVDCTQKLSAQAWRESVMANVDYVIEQEEDILTPAHFLHIVLRRDESSPADHLTAIVLRDSSEINSSLFRMDSGLYSGMCCGSSSEGPSDSMETYLSSLPHMTGDLVDQINASLVHMQTHMLQDWVAELEQSGEATVMSVEMLYKFLGQIQQNFLDKLLQDGVFQEAARRGEESDTIPSLEPDTDMDPLDWPERKAVQHRDTQKREMRRYQSSESACLSSPPHADDGVSTIEVKDFIKLFNPDGSASIDKLSPIRQSRRKLTKLSSQGETTLLWPDCMDTLYHGIDYYKDKISEKNEKHYSSLREKFIKNETCSSFTTKHILTKKKPHKLESGDKKRKSGSLMSPSRKSPRGQLSSLQPLKDEIRSSSQPSRQKMLLQHPGLKSPRKRQTLPSEKLRRSPRKQPSASFQRLKSDSHVLPLPPKRKRRSDPDLLTRSDDRGDVFSSQRCDKPSQSRPVSTASAVDDERAKKQSRSERHKKKLEQIVKSVLVHHGVDEESAIFKSCADKLFQVTKFFVKTLPNSRNLSQEMKTIAEGQVTQVVDLEKRRQEMKRPSRK